MPHYADIESVVQALDQAASPVDAVQVVLRWLGDQHGPAAIRLLNDAEIITGPHQVIDNEVLDWLRQPANWRDWHTARWLPAVYRSRARPARCARRPIGRLLLL